MPMTVQRTAHEKSIVRKMCLSLSEFFQRNIQNFFRPFQTFSPRISPSICIVRRVGALFIPRIHGSSSCNPSLRRRATKYIFQTISVLIPPANLFAHLINRYSIQIRPSPRAFAVTPMNISFATHTEKYAQLIRRIIIFREHFHSAYFIIYIWINRICIFDIPIELHCFTFRVAHSCVCICHTQ